MCVQTVISAPAYNILSHTASSFKNCVGRGHNMHEYSRKGRICGGGNSHHLVEVLCALSLSLGFLFLFSVHRDPISHS